jgi:hypothetical protein
MPRFERMLQAATDSELVAVIEMAKEILAYRRKVQRAKLKERNKENNR